MSVYNMQWKTAADPKPLCIKFDKMGGFVISFDDKIKHVLLFGYGLLNKIWEKTEFL